MSEYGVRLIAVADRKYDNASNLTHIGCGDSAATHAIPRNLLYTEINIPEIQYMAK